MEELEKGDVVEPTAYPSPQPKFLPIWKPKDDFGSSATHVGLTEPRVYFQDVHPRKDDGGISAPCGLYSVL